MNASLHAMIISILGICVFRVIWINTACVMFPAIETVYISYPVTWILTFTAEFICFLIIK